MPIGILDCLDYSANEADLNAGDQIILFSVVLPEARNEQGEEWGLDGFIQSLPKGHNAAKTTSLINQVWESHVGRASQHDDSTFLMLDWRGPKPGPLVQLNCCPDSLCNVRRFIEPWAIHAGLGDIDTGRVVAACDEAVSNIFRHAYRGKPGPIVMSAELVSNRLKFTISDHAGKVDLDRIKGRDLDDLRPGGLGTVIMGKVFDDVQYATSESGTTLTLIKKLSEMEPSPKEWD